MLGTKKEIIFQILQQFSTNVICEGIPNRAHDNRKWRPSESVFFQTSNEEKNNKSKTEGNCELWVGLVG